MQQLFAAFGINWSLLLAQAVNFAIVLVALWYFLYRPVSVVLAKRQAIIAKGIEDASAAEKQLAHAEAEAKARVLAADAESQQIVAHARTAASVEKTRLMEEAENHAAAIMEDAEAHAAETVARARRDSEKDVARLAVLAAEKILKERHD